MNHLSFVLVYAFVSADILGPRVFLALLSDEATKYFLGDAQKPGTREMTKDLKTGLKARFYVRESGFAMVYEAKKLQFIVISTFGVVEISDISDIDNSLFTRTHQLLEI